ncbi:hypothetical protein [Clostridium sp. SM-530-WT-3G]|uniref:hypothetical protein n=1 Tax=Clostridium sp. SM-530-WT-3G TaxID=2725303 RepID=UPI00145F267E|nr:hypothetical protein [Clostridium sp. SM-530-WT-3G]NME83158.1 hypothetical protein [Clostridium sp. SM-530-WT-3G]
MHYLAGAFIIVSILFMCVFMFIGIWSFIVFLKSYRQTRYQNYILEKISQKLNSIANSMPKKEDSEDKYAYLTGEEDFEFTEDNDDRLSNVTNINKQH